LTSPLVQDLAIARLRAMLGEFAEGVDPHTVTSSRPPFPPAMLDSSLLSASATATARLAEAAHRISPTAADAISLA